MRGTPKTLHDFRINAFPTLFVIRPDGRIAYVTKPFKVMTPVAYTDLAAVVDSLAPAKADSAK